MAQPRAVVVADSAAALDPALCDRYGVIVVPMGLEVGGRPVPEADVALEELLRHLDDGIQTSAPSPGAFATAVEAAAAGGASSVVIVTVGSNLSSSYQSATAAASIAPPGVQVRVVDSGTAAGAEGLVVLAAAEAAQAGASADDVEQRAHMVVDRVRLVASVGELKYLVRGGRLTAAATRAGEHLGVRPVFELRKGKIRPLRPSLSSDGAVDQILAQWRKSVSDGDKLHVAALSAMRDEDAAALLEKVEAEVEPATALVGKFGPVMVAHTGPGVIGLAWWWESPEAS
ncbi:MAG TPA: DegV family protein [Acidimicrobiales bacterium]|nr:DegV family protein [Acidimicrobiales bacterium]